MTTYMKKFTGIAASLALAVSMAAPAVVHAQLTSNDLGVGAVQNDLALSGGDVRQTAARIINVSLGFLGIIAVVIVLIGGFKYMVSGGNEEKTSEARRLIVSGIIGLAIILSAWAITSFVITQLVSATN
jgi:hypothetical protein